MASLLIEGGIVLTMDKRRRVFEDGAVAIEDGKIVGVGKGEEVKKDFKHEEAIDARKRIVMPGLVCSHTHLYGVLLRGAPLEVEPPSDFTQILQRIWWPLDEALSYEDAYASALVASLEMLKTGTTLFADTYSGPNSIDGVLDRISSAVEKVGIRALISFEATERHSREEGMRGVLENARFAKKVADNPSARAMPMFSIHASFTASNHLISEVRRLATELKVPITIHVSEGPGDLHHNLQNYGQRTLERLKHVGLLGPDVVLAHCVWLDEDEIDIIASSGAKVAHNPMSNMLNAVGVAPIIKMLQKGVTVGIGNDGYVLDGFENMRAAFLLHRVHQRDPRAMDPYSVLEMATVNGAKLYGLHERFGSLEVGKEADIIIVKPHVIPTPLTGKSVAGHLVHAVSGRDVETVIVGGEVVMRDKKVITANEEDVQELSQRAAAALWDRLKGMGAQIDRAKVE